MAYQSEIEKLQRRYEEKPEQWFAAYADAYRKAGELDVALEIVRSGIEERPNYVSGFIVLGRCLVDQSKDDEAQQAFEQVLALDAENIIALDNLGEVAERQNDIAAARRWRERLLEVDPMNDKARSSLERLAAASLAPPAEENTPVPEAVAEEQDTPSAVDEPAGLEVEAPPLMDLDPDLSEPPIHAPAAPFPEPAFEPPAPIDDQVETTAISSEGEGIRDGFPSDDAGPELVSADDGTEGTSESDEDLSSIFGSPPAPPAPPEPPSAISPKRSELSSDESRFLIERQSDPFETPNEAKVAEQDAAALWASLGEDPELESVPDASRTPEGPAETMADSGPVRESGDAPEPTVPEAFEPGDDRESAAQSGPAPSDQPVGVGGTTQMSATDLNALVEQERREAEERREALQETSSVEERMPDERDGASDVVIGSPPLEYQLDTPQPQRGSQGIPVFSDPELQEDLAVEGSEEQPVVRDQAVHDIETTLEPVSDTPRAGEPVSSADAPGDDVGQDGAPRGSDEPDDVLTETMAEVYAAQGLFAQARDVYRKLQERRPTDTGIQERLAAIDARERDASGAETRVAAATVSPPAKEYAANRTGGPSARAFLSTLLGQRPNHDSAETLVEPTETTVLDETFASDRSDSRGEPTGPAVDEMSLASVFGDRTPDTGEHRRPSTEHVPPPPPPSPPQSAPSSDEADLSFDSFFSGSGEAPGGAQDDEEGGGDDDDEDFKAWLKSLKS